MFAFPVSQPILGRTYNPQKAGTWPQVLNQVLGKAGTRYGGKKPKLYRKNYLDKAASSGPIPDTMSVFMA